MPSSNTPTPPRTSADRASARKPLSEAELAEARDEMRRDAEWTAALIEKYGYPFEGSTEWGTDVDDEPDAA